MLKNFTKKDNSYLTCTLLLLGLVYVAKMYIVLKFFLLWIIKLIVYILIESFTWKCLIVTHLYLFISFLKLYAYITRMLQFIVWYD